MKAPSPAPSERTLASSTDGADADVEALNDSNLPEIGVTATELINDMSSVHIAGKKRRLEDEQSTSAVADVVYTDAPSSDQVGTKEDTPAAKKARLSDLEAAPRLDTASDGLAPEDSSPPSKKARLNNLDGAEDTVPDSTEASPVARTPGPLQLPLELLAEILILTGSPEHVLAIARTCKALCHTLLSPDAQFIWREARKGPGCTFAVTAQVEIHPIPPPAIPQTVLETRRYVFQLPDPPAQFFGEAAYAAFVFDSGKCDCCSKDTSVPYTSFALRIRQCKNRKCRKPPIFIQFVDGLRADSIPLRLKVSEILPVNEMPSFSLMDPILRPRTWPDNSFQHYVRTKDIESAMQEFLRDQGKPSYQAKFEALKSRKEQWMKFCAQLDNWKRARVQLYRRNKVDNEKLGRQIASKYGWAHKDFFEATVYGAYQSLKNRLIEKVDEFDIKMMKEEIEAQLLAHEEKVERRTAEISLMNNRKDVEDLYLRLRSSKDHPYLPSLATFRKLPVISMLQSAEPGTSTSSVTQTLQSNLMMKNLLTSQLKKWTETAMRDLGIVLGFPKNWKSASKNILHPVERVTARFLCTKCHRVDVRYRDDEALDFAGACIHECGVGNAKKGRIVKGKKNVWDVANFVKDDKAINALKKCLEILGYAEEMNGGNYLLKTGIAVVCMSCDPSMVLDTRNVIGHSHRHDKMEIKVESLDTITSYLAGYPYDFGIVQKLMGPAASTVGVKAEIERKNFGCRHCLRSNQIIEAAAAAEAAASTDTNSMDTTDDNNGIVAEDPDSKTQIELSTVVTRVHHSGIEGPLEKPPPLFTFNGMRSHLKSKHGTENIRDEDIFCFREVLL